MPTLTRATPLTMMAMHRPISDSRAIFIGALPISWYCLPRAAIQYRLITHLRGKEATTLEEGCTTRQLVPAPSAFPSKVLDHGCWVLGFATPPAQHPTPNTRAESALVNGSFPEDMRSFCKLQQNGVCSSE